MQEINEGNIYNVEDVMGAHLSPEKLGLKNFKSQLKSQLFDYLKRNNIQNSEEVIKKTFGDLLETKVDTGGKVTDGTLIPSFDSLTNPTGAGVVIVTNPKGEGFKAPEASLGMGFALPTTIIPNLQQFVNFYHGMGNDEAESAKYELERKANEENPEEDTGLTWQKANGAVSNYVSQSLKQTLQRFGALLPDDQYQQNQNSPPNTYHYDPYSRQVYRLGKFKGENL